MPNGNIRHKYSHYSLSREPVILAAERLYTHLVREGDWHPICARYWANGRPELACEECTARGIPPDNTRRARLGHHQ